MFISRRFFQVTSIIFILTLLFSGLPMPSVQAQGKDGLKRQVNPQTGRVSFLGPETGLPLPASQALGITSFARPADPALALAKRFGPEFGLKNPERDLTELRTNRSENGRQSVRFQQHYQGIPVMGGELIVNTDEDGDLYSMNGEVSSNLPLSTQPTIDSEQARQSALRAVSKWYQKAPEDFVTSEPALWIYDESLLRSSTRPAELVWRMEVTPKDAGIPVRELVLINAQRGSISLHFNEIDAAWQSRSDGSSINSNLFDSHAAVNENSLVVPALSVKTYTANSGSALPGTLLCNQTDPNCAAGDSHAKAAHKYAIGTFNLYATQFGRNSIDNNGMTITSTVHYCESIISCPFGNAFWSGAQMVYGDAYGFPLADDVVGHELTHGVTQYESSLFYYYQSGAINESFSDLWGEYYDQTNGLGTDTAGVKWQIGEDISDLGTIRNMSDPAAFGDPDKMSSGNYDESEDDNGGVHHNSGLNNKAVFLMVDGGSFNGKTVTALGWTKTVAIYYEVNTNLLTSGADYSDLYYALQQACSNLIGQKGITAGNCTEVKDAIDAVEMNGQPAPNFNTDAPYCDGDNSILATFSDDLESGTGNWTFNNGAYKRWQIDSSDGPFAQSGLHSLYADDKPDVITDASARLKSFVVPNNAYLRFAQAYGFESGINFSDFNFYDYDGGVLEYSLNNGSTWVDAGSLIDFNGYTGTIFTGAGNPLSGRSAFVGSSHGYISTRLNLSSLAGKTVTFRWRMGLDEATATWGWWVDNLKVYTCGTPNVEVLIGAQQVGTYYVPGGGHVNPNFPGKFDGPVEVRSINGQNLLASERAIFGNSFTETLGVSNTALATRYWFSWYDGVTMQTWISVGAPSTNTQDALVDIYIGGIKMNASSYVIPPGGQVSPNFPGKFDGPVEVRSTNGQNLLASERAIFGSSFTETLGVPNPALTTRYWFSWYDGMTMQTWMSLGAPTTNTQDALVDIYIGGVKMNINSYQIPPGGQVSPNFPGKFDGPVEVRSTNGQNILVSERAIYGSSFTETLGVSNTALTTKYWFSWYDGLTMSTWISVGAPSTNTQDALVDIYIGGVKKNASPIVVPAGGQVSPSFSGTFAGPVEVRSTNGQNILASERAIYGSSFTETLGVPNPALTTRYWFSWYDGLTMSTWISVGAP